MGKGAKLESSSKFSLKLDLRPRGPIYSLSHERVSDGRHKGFIPKLYTCRAVVQARSVVVPVLEQGGIMPCTMVVLPVDQ